MLDASGECGWIAPMKTKFQFFAAFLGLAIFVAGCVDTVTGRKTAAVPFVRDTKVSRYERPMMTIFNAAKEVMAYNGTLTYEGDYHPPGETNAPSRTIKTIEGKVNQRTVWVRVEQIDSKTSEVQTQTRTSAGVPDIELAEEIDKQIMAKLMR